MSEHKRDRERVADILLEALAMADQMKESEVLIYLIKLTLLEVDHDFQAREYFKQKPDRYKMPVSA